MPCAVGRLILHRVAAATRVFDVNVLHLGAKVGKAPRDMGVVADDNKRHSPEETTPET